MRKNKLVFLATIGMVLMATPILHFNDTKSTDDVGPMFYAASYEDDLTAEPYYPAQRDYGFSNMGFDTIHQNYRGDAVKVAVIDSGLNYEHEDFKDKNGNKIIQGHSRTIDNSSGSWLYYQYSSGWQSKINDTLGHGTNVASCIASQINSIGCAGVAPNVDLYVYKVTNTNNGYEWTAINSALQYCIDEEIDVINMSFQAYEHEVSYNGYTMGASSGCSTVLAYMLNKCYNAGITLVAAAGNYNTTERSYPASNNHVISVGSLAEGSATERAGYSNKTDIDLVAPGTVYVADKGSTNAYKRTQGTSFSAPIVTAAIALYKQKYPYSTPSEVENALLSSCDSIGGDSTGWSGFGRLNIQAFLDNETVSPTSVTLSKHSLELDLNGNYEDTLTATVLPNNATTKTVTWSSSNSSVVSVDNAGKIKGKNVGTATITVKTIDGRLSDKCEVTVINSDSGIRVNTPEENISISLADEPYQLVWTTTPNEYDVEFSLYSDEGVISIDENGVITPLKIGEEIVSISVKDHPESSVDIMVTVTDALSSIEMIGAPTEIPYKGDFDTSSIEIRANYASGESKIVTPTSHDYSIDTSIIGPHEIFATYEEDGISKTVRKIIKVTNHNASSNVGNIVFGSETTSSVTFSSKNGSKTNNGIQFTPNGTGFESSGDARGVQWYGKSGNISCLFTTSGKYLVKSVSLVASTNDSSAFLSVSVDDDLFDGTWSMNKGDKKVNVTFVGNKICSSMSVSVVQNSKSVWIKSITVVYQKVMSSKPATPVEQAKAWSTYFLNSVKGYCDISGVGSDTDGIAGIWSELADEYGYMTSDSKNEFFTSEDATIVEARTLYRMIVNKYHSESITDFATDGNGNYFNLIKSIQNSNSYSIKFFVIISTIFVVSASLSIVLLYIKKKNKDSNN